MREELPIVGFRAFNIIRNRPRIERILQVFAGQNFTIIQTRANPHDPQNPRSIPDV
jgi:hypothetical protein